MLHNNTAPETAYQENFTLKSNKTQCVTSLLSHNEALLKSVQHEINSLEAETEDLGVNNTKKIAKLAIKRKQVVAEIERLQNEILAQAQQYNAKIRAMIESSFTLSIASKPTSKPQTIHPSQQSFDEVPMPTNAICCFAGRTLKEKFWNNDKYMLFVGYRPEIEEILQRICNEQFFMKRNGNSQDQAKLFVPRHLFHLLRGATTVKFASIAA